MHPLSKGLFAVGLGLSTAAGWAQAQQTAPPPQPPAAPANQPGADHARHGAPGPIDSLQDLQDAGKMLFKLADTNNDGAISQKEANDAGNLLVGGFFFRADANGDGTLSKEEADAARESLFRQQPLLRFALQRGKTGVQQANSEALDAAKSAINSIKSSIDANRDNQLQASELRQAVKLGVDGLFQVADTNQDQQLAPIEINAAIIAAARTTARTAFQTADADDNGQVSRDEFEKAIIQPARVAFMLFDRDGDGQISPEELKTAGRIIASHMRNLRVPEPPNSLGRMIRSGRSPEEAGVVPTIRTPKEADQQVQPASAPTGTQ